jgi:hypothetical protein
VRRTLGIVVFIGWRGDIEWREWLDAAAIRQSDFYRIR